MNLPRLLFPLARPLLHALDPETAHRLTVRALGMMPHTMAASDPRLHSRVMGLDFPNPLGLAAGFDKNADVQDAMLGLGFGFVEVGSVTPRPQDGNPRPRLFRLAEDDAVINRMGFNNVGHDAVLKRLTARRAKGGIVAVNLGANKDSADRTADYVEGLKRFADVASYVTVNISSPNTPGLRTLQSADELEGLLSRLMEARAQVRRVPVVLKVAPDLVPDELAALAAACLRFGVDAIAMSNTTVSRPGLKSPHAKEAGGLSGKPLLDLSTRQLANLRLLTGGRIPLIGIGGIFDAESAWAKIAAGASLLQLYTALTFRGPGLVGEILDGVLRICARKGYAQFSEAVGTKADAIAHHGLSGT
jgi:dihydroorotate dehydrogenase